MVTDEASRLFREHLKQIFKRTDRMFAGLMIFQWIAGIVIALTVSPKSWAGAQSHVHLHVWAAILLGGAIAAFPVYLAIWRSGTTLTRHSIAIGQMLTSALLIHLTGGQIETHFHVFGSLAFLAFYRDWRVLLTATVVVSVDHLVRGLYWPQSVYGVLSASVWRTMEHAGWVVFEDVFLLISIKQSLSEMRRDANRTVELVKENAHRKQAEGALRLNQERFQIAVRGSNDGLWDWNVLSNDVYYSPRYKELLGYGEDELEDTFDTFETRLHPADRGHTLDAISNHLENNTNFDAEFRLQTKSGDFCWFRARAKAIRDGNGSAVRMAGSLLDITDRKLAEEKLRHDAYHDSLTGLPNRATVVDILVRAVARAKRHPGYAFAVLFLDLDRFKVINDSLGHMAGDQLLVEVTQRLLKCLRQEDIVARLGGDEFTVFLDNIHEQSDGFFATKVAERILESLATPFLLDGEEVFIGTSIGIALCKATYSSPEDILRDADTAMYRAKSGGRGRFEIFDTAMHQRVRALLHMENDLRRAIERDQLRLHYQPIVSLSSGQIIGFEALVRWQHPDHGLVPPMEFIPLAEETGLIMPIGEWVLGKACSWMSQTLEQQPESSAVTISVNVSGRQFAQPGFPKVIAAALLETGLPAQHLKLEITESTLMDGGDSARKLLAELRAMDVQLMIDDFGTGYSSLSYLSVFPLNALKIDRSFINKLGSAEDTTEIVRCILVLANTLNLDVVAEGVETSEQADMLRTLGTSFAQGYFFSAPVDGDAAMQLMGRQLVDTSVPNP